MCYVYCVMILPYIQLNHTNYFNIHKIRAYLYIYKYKRKEFKESFQVSYYFIISLLITIEFYFYFPQAKYILVTGLYVIMLLLLLCISHKIGPKLERLPKLDALASEKNG